MARRFRGLSSIGCRAQDTAAAWSTLSPCAAASPSSSSPSSPWSLVGRAPAPTTGGRCPRCGPDQTTTTRRRPPTARGRRSSVVHARAATAFADGGEIPARYTCAGEGVSPALRWTGTPADAAELALVVRDRDAGGYVHWVVTGIDPSSGLRRGGRARGRGRAGQRHRRHRATTRRARRRARRAHLRLHAARPRLADRHRPAAARGRGRPPLIETTSSSEATFAGIVTTAEPTG